MLKVASYDIVFQEIPGEVTLALNLSGCPCHCPGCHSPHLWEDTGEPLDGELLEGLMARYEGLITCVAFMGGDAEPDAVLRLAEHVRYPAVSRQHSELKTAWYSGRPATPETYSGSLDAFDYVKFGPYVEALGGLKSEHTNQRLYKRVGDGWEDVTSAFWKKTL
jgi:anaerobic ribonucleoside-triphosphate reductase activating protein